MPRPPVTLRRLYGAVGALWGLVLGPPAGFALAAFAAGVSWLFLFGDDPWPEAIGWVLPALGAVAALAVLAGATTLGWRYGAAAEGLPPDRAPALRRRAHVLLALALLLGGALAALAVHRAGEPERARGDAAAREKGFARLLAGRQVLGSVTVEAGGAAFRIAVRSEGRGGGPYRLGWTVRDGGYRRTLVEDGRTVRLRPGGNVETLSIPALPLARNYRSIVLGGARADVLVEEDFRLTVVLEPVLDEAQLASLPAHERRNIELGDSPLIERRDIALPVRFVIRDGEITFGR